MRIGAVVKDSDGHYGQVKSYTDESLVAVFPTANGNVEKTLGKGEAHRVNGFDLDGAYQVLKQCTGIEWEKKATDHVHLPAEAEEVEGEEESEEEDEE